MSMKIVSFQCKVAHLNPIKNHAHEDHAIFITLNVATQETLPIKDTMADEAEHNMTFSRMAF